jgi:chromosome segregation ATPase
MADGARVRTSIVLSPLLAGRLMVGIAILGLVVGVVGTVIAAQLARDLDRGVGQSLELTASVLETIDDSFVIAEDALAILIEGVAEAETAVRALSRSMAEGQDALTAATDLTGGEVADALENVEQSLPAIQSAADTIDATLAALSTLPFGPAYDADRSLGASIGELREDLRGLPEELRQQAEQVERTTTELTAATAGTVATADSLAELDDRLVDASELVGQYALRTGEARALVDTQRDALTSSASRAQVMVVAFGVMFVLAQFVPFYLGFALLGRAEVVGERWGPRPPTDPPPVAP